MTRGFPEKGGRHGDDGLEIGRQGMKPIADFLDLAKDQNKPFFIWYAPFLPHTPHNPPQRLLDKYQTGDRPISIAKYYAMCEWFDETCGQLENLVQERELSENTLYVYVTDNGWIQDPKSRKYAPRSKQSPYEGGIRTPIFFRWPNQLTPQDRPELVSSIDLVPTILGFADANLPKGLPGLNLKRIFSNSVLSNVQLFLEKGLHTTLPISTRLRLRSCTDGALRVNGNSCSPTMGRSIATPHHTLEKSKHHSCSIF